MKPTTIVPMFIAFLPLFYLYFGPQTQQPQPLISGTYLNEYNPDTTDWQGERVLCSVDNETPPVTGALMTFTSFTARIMIEYPTHPNYESIPDTYADQGIVLYCRFRLAQ